MFCTECGQEILDNSKYCSNCGSGLKITAERPSSIISDNTEISYYSDDRGVRITNTRAIFGKKTYVMGNISSISLGQKSPNYTFAIILVLCGLVSMFISAILGLIVCIIGILVALFAKGEYTVKITSASGETDALVDSDKDYIQDVVNAMQEAIIKRG